MSDKHWTELLREVRAAADHERGDALDALETAVKRELGRVRCRHGWRGSKPKNGNIITTPCPACGGQLFVGKEGHLTCSRLDCPEPGVEWFWKRELARKDDALRAALDWMTTVEHLHPAGWYWYDSEYPDEGSVGVFATKDEAIESAMQSYEDDARIELGEGIESCVTFWESKYPLDQIRRALIEPEGRG